MRVRMTRGLRLLACLVAAMGWGCSHQAPRVNCDMRLVPINSPAPKAKQTPKEAPPSPTSETPGDDAAAGGTHKP